ncbi:origin recognition complex subunit 2 [Maudiozyma humilis]|uniref:Origin recognition complex subunit 2 n=1 Tax=Maudiozyma humilis TaxID=51915 RepID=A0AAV5RUG9_MAUHU|nr:origin recognition complex subunit 2 [Kazachstania humilis]
MADEDIVAHTDILSSPSKRGTRTAARAGRPPIKLSDGRLHRRLSPRKELIDAVVSVESPEKQEQAELQLAVESATEAPRPRKRGRPRKSEQSNVSTVGSTTTPKKPKFDVEVKISAENILPERSRRTRKPVSFEESDQEGDDSEDKDAIIEQSDEESDDAIDAVSDDNDISFDEPIKQEEPAPPKRKRGRPRKIVETVKSEPRGFGQGDKSLPDTPRKKSTTISADQTFTSPIKKIIMSNLEEYKKQVSFDTLKLSKDFKPTRLPPSFNERRIKQLQSERTNNSFLDTFEGYMDQKKVLRNKSKNTMAMAPAITRAEFATVTNLFNKDFQKASKQKLSAIQKGLFPQYWFEASQGFTLLFYGIGSKREFLEDLAVNYLSRQLRLSEVYTEQLADPSYTNPYDTAIPCVVVNGYNPTCNYRDVFKDIFEIMFPKELENVDVKYWGNHCMLQIQKMAEYYRTQPLHTKLIVAVHSLDGPSVRKRDFQLMMSALALIKQVTIVASVDNIYAPLLWDDSKSQNYNFIYHNVTNYEASAVESSFQDVMKLGRDDSTTGAEGAKYVLESLTANAKKLYKLLLETQVSAMQAAAPNGKVVPTRRGVMTLGMDLKKFHDMCTAEFIVSNEVSLRTILKEFTDHKMAVVSKKQGTGSEMIWVPYNYSEMTKLLSTVLAKAD